ALFPPLSTKNSSTMMYESTSHLIRDIGFIHLHVHTSYSLREGALTIGTLAKRARADKMPALAITDTNALFGALEFSEKMAKDGIQPIIGMHLLVEFGDGALMGGRTAPHLPLGRGGLILLAQTEVGYLNLMHLASCAWLDPAPGEGPYIPIT